jgi:hypothetical protein
VVGSALVAQVESAANPQAAAHAVGDLVRSLKGAARAGVSRRSSQTGSEQTP